MAPPPNTSNTPPQPTASQSTSTAAATPPSTTCPRTWRSQSTSSAPRHARCTTSATRGTRPSSTTRARSPLDDDPVLGGRCEVATFSQRESDRASSLLSSFGNDLSNIPEFGGGNCQDWVAGAVAVLEAAGVGVGCGEGGFWKGMVNRSAKEIKQACVASGRTWVDGPNRRFEGDPDARFAEGGEGEGRVVGRLRDNPVLRERMRGLVGNHNSEEGSNGVIPERPFYVSSPFFSRMDGDA
ncbi:hypothetical protein BO71DRAFT_469888 [Aspergillus ellipticus CBS 707.79]|uniref:Uncharacterized protein n=1 Tax=Aspergillus ellipticus CBS 707.79 TaxID=1448320 RepID=A0A319DHC0_9EURO|nr:hypothetical protein BO71DRAFT_469888 [Aspergillus ellipticus CBS 707.79]